MSRDLERVEALLAESSISSEDKAGLIALFRKAAPQALLDAVDLFSENPEWIHKIAENYKAKKTSFASKDDQRLKRILDEEESELQRMSD